ncbi:MAG: YwiC-like family protein [Myxococcota bacterium]
MPKRRPHAPSLWPREHGAYMELGFPILSAWILGSPGPASFALGAAAVVAFLAHEPMLVAFGRRGPRRQREQGPAARRRLALLATIALALGGTGLWLAAPAVRWLVLVPVAAGLLSLLLAVAGKERSLIGEIHVALSLSSIALPVATAAGMAPSAAGVLVGVWVAGFSVGTVAARGVLLQKRDRGRGLRLATWAALVVTAGGAALAASGLLPPATALAPLPFALVALALAFRPPPPQRMTAIGFGLVGAATATLLTLTLGPG